MIGRARERGGRSAPGGRRRRLFGLVGIAVVAALSVGAVADEADSPPVIVDVAAPERLRVGTQGEVRLRFRAPRADVVAVIQAIEDLDGPPLRRGTRQREIGVIARAFGFESGELRVPLSFTTPGRKRVTLILVTDERVESEPAAVEVEATP